MYLNGTKCAALALGCFLSLSAIAKNAIPAVGQGVQKPLSFIENKGQFTDADGKHGNDIQFRMSTAGMNLYLGNGQLHYQFRKLQDADGANPTMKTYGMSVTLLGANPAAKVEAQEPQAYYENYYTNGTANGITAHAYNRVVYKEVYPGIDWVVYVKGDKVEYDFVVRPGADASKIQLQYGGATALNITADGGITAETPMGKVQEKKPYAYESMTGIPVAANFKLHNNIVSFETAKCNGTLTIDPLILWSTYFGGALEDVATGVKISGGSNTYIGGYTSSTTVGFVGTGTSIDATYNGGVYDAFITKYDPTGVRQWTTYFGGGGNDQGTCVGIDAGGGGIYLGGFTSGSTGLGAGALWHPANNGLIDGFLLKINNNGTRQWSTYYGGAGNDYVYGVTCDPASNVYITGRTESPATIASAGVFQTSLSGSSDAFIAKFASASGANTYSTYYGGSGVDEGAGIACDGSNNVTITGQTNSVTNIASAGAHQAALSGANDAFIGQLNTTGTARLWGTYFGGTGAEQGTDAICNTVTGDVAIIGYTTSTAGIASANAHQSTYGGGVQDAFVAYFSTAGARTWSTYYGGSGLDYGEGITLDPQRNVVIAGGTFSTNGISTPGSLQPANGGNYDAFVAKFTPLGQRMWGSYFGNALYDYAFGVACDLGGQIVMAGHTTSTTGIASVGAAQGAYGGGTYDAFLTKLRPDTFVVINQPYTDTLICQGGPLRISYTANTPFQPGNIFSAQISNAAGVFPAMPANVIGTVAATGSGIINCTIPIATPLGTGYRIRIVASNPAFTSPDEFKNIEVRGPLPSTTPSANTPVCVGGTLNLTTTATWSISSYSWTGPAAFAAGIQSPSISGIGFANEGVYSVVTTHNGCANGLATIAVDVNDVIPVSPVAASSAPVCQGAVLNFYADTALSVPDADSYSWTGPSGFTSTMQNPSIASVIPGDAGTYSVVGVVDGCPSAPTTLNIVISPTSFVSLSINVSPNDTVCNGTLVNFTSVPVNGGVSPTFQWMRGATPVVGANSSIWSSSTLTDGNSISLVMNSNALCPSPTSITSNVIKMNVITNEPTANIFASPGTSVSLGDSVTFTSAVYNVGVGATYQWRRNSVDIPGATNNKYVRHNITTFDTITLIVTSTMGCTTSPFAKSNAIVVHPNTAVNDISALLSSVELFPNPNTGQFTVKGDFAGFNTNSVSISVINPLGQVVLSSEAALQNGKLNKTISLDNVPSGMYLLQLNADGVTKTIRFTTHR